MTTVSRTVTTTTPLATVWPYLSDFTTVTQWDPNTPDCRLIEGGGGVGSRYAITSVFRGRETHLEYTVRTLEPHARFVLHGENATVSVVEDMTLDELPDAGTRVVYRADFAFHGPSRLATPFLGGALRRIADDARDGMQTALDALDPGGPRPVGFEVRSEWKELVHYREGDRQMTFDAAWGVKPHVLYVPDPSIWDDVVPPWLVGRCALVTGRLREYSHHEIRLTTEGYAPRRAGS